MPFIAMVAGPNGSGKTTLIQHLRSRGVDLGEYVNADDIAADLSGANDKGHYKLLYSFSSRCRVAAQEIE